MLRNGVAFCRDHGFGGKSRILDGCSQRSMDLQLRLYKSVRVKAIRDIGKMVLVPPPGPNLPLLCGNGCGAASGTPSLPISVRSVPQLVWAEW